MTECQDAPNNPITREMIVAGLAVIFGVAAVAEGLMLLGFQTSNNHLKATGTALSGQIASGADDCNLAQATMQGQIDSLGAEVTWRRDTAETQSAQLTQIMSGTPISVEVTRLVEATREVTVVVTPTGQICYVPVTATRTPTATDTATATRTATGTMTPTLALRNTDIPTPINTRPVPTNTNIAPTPVPTNTEFIPTATPFPQPTNTEQVPTATAPIPTPAPTNSDIIPTATISTP